MSIFSNMRGLFRGTDNAADQGWRRPEILLIVMAGSMAFCFAIWMALLNNFAVEVIGFNGQDMGLLQSLREVPGFMAFAAVYLLFFFREQTIAYLAILMLGLGVAATGFFPSLIGFYITTFVMSLGFHYYETMQQALTLQLVTKENAPLAMGRQISARAAASLLAFALMYGGLQYFQFDYAVLYAVAGGVTIFVTLLVWAVFPRFQSDVAQRKNLVFRKRYWLFYALTFMGGARRQIFIVFAGFMMVEKFGYAVSEIVLLYLLNHSINIFLAPRIGRFIARWGERRALIFEYVGLICVFSAYAFVSDATLAAGLYVVDHLFFAFAIAIKSYFQKIADPADIASTAGVAFSINHIAAVVVPASFGLIWMVFPPAVFLLGAAMAGISLVLAFNVPHAPRPGFEVLRVPGFLASKKAAGEAD